MKKLMLAVIVLTSTGCRSSGLDRLIGGREPEQGTPYVAPVGDLNARPLYDQTTATTAQDDNLIRHIIGEPGTDSFAKYVAEPWLPDRMNGIHNLAAGSRGFNSLIVDAWKALYRRGYLDLSKVNDPSVIHSNAYPVPVYQGDPSDFGL